MFFKCTPPRRTSSRILYARHGGQLTDGRPRFSTVPPARFANPTRTSSPVDRFFFQIPFALSDDDDACRFPSSRVSVPICLHFFCFVTFVDWDRWTVEDYHLLRRLHGRTCVFSSVRLFFLHFSRSYVCSELHRNDFGSCRKQTNLWNLNRY